MTYLSDLLQVTKAFYLKWNTFVAIKRINAFEKVGTPRLTWNSSKA